MLQIFLKITKRINNSAKEQISVSAKSINNSQDKKSTMRSNMTLPFMPSQPVSPAQLLSKLSHIKSANETSSHKLKQIKQVQQKISFYEDYCTSNMDSLQKKLQGINNEVTELKKSFKKAENLGVVKFDTVQRMLENTLDQYEKDREKGQQMIDKVVQSVQEQLQKTIMQKSFSSSLLVEEYLKLNTRLQSVLSSLNSMESQLMSQYQKLRTQLNKKFQTIEREILLEIQEIDRSGDCLLKKLERIEHECENEINSINQRKQNKRYRLHQVMEKMIEDVVEDDDFQ